MITIILDGLVLLGLMFVFDRKNPNRDFLETGLVAVILVIAAVLLNRFVTPQLGWFSLVLYFGLCVFLLWKLPEIPVRRALVIAAVFVAFKVVEPFCVQRAAGGEEPMIFCPLPNRRLKLSAPSCCGGHLFVNVKASRRSLSAFR